MSHHFETKRRLLIELKSENEVIFLPFKTVFKKRKEELIKYVLKHKLRNVRGFGAVNKYLNKFDGSYIAQKIEKQTNSTFNTLHSVAHGENKSPFVYTFAEEYIKSFYHLKWSCLKKGIFNSTYIYNDKIPISLKILDSEDEVKVARSQMEAQLKRQNKWKQVDQCCQISFEEYYQLSTSHKRAYEMGLKWELEMRKTELNVCDNCKYCTLTKMKKKSRRN